jgi:hypothetical protein
MKVVKRGVLAERQNWLMLQRKEGISATPFNAFINHAPL